MTIEIKMRRKYTKLFEYLKLKGNSRGMSHIDFPYSHVLLTVHRRCKSEYDIDEDHVTITTI